MHGSTAMHSGNAQVLLVSRVDGYSLTIWREADGEHGAHWKQQRKVADCELWLPDAHKCLASYLLARAGEWPVDEPVEEPVPSAPVEIVIEGATYRLVTA
jgi:hypothetical protein